jgi:hypothetical protein
VRLPLRGRGWVVGGGMGIGIEGKVGRADCAVLYGGVITECG